MQTLSETLLTQGSQYRLILFLSLFATLCLLETLFRRRNLTQSKKKRWAQNLGIMLIDILFMRVLFPLGALGAATIANSNKLGLFHLLESSFSVDTSTWLFVALGVVFMDFAIYWQHRLMHTVPLLWRLHRFHHTDRDLDVSSASRFHPLEIAFSMGLKYLLIFALGLPVITVFIFEATLNSLAMFNHSNLKLPKKVDFWVQKLVVTPDMHRVHHSVIVEESNSNYGFCLSIWDSIFGSYCKKEYSEQDQITLGLNEFNNDEDHRFLNLLKNPFLSR